MLNSIPLFLILFMTFNCSSIPRSESDGWENYLELVQRVKYLEYEHYFTTLGPMAEKYFRDPNFGSGIYAYKDGELLKLGPSDDPNEIVTIAGHPINGWTYCVYRSFYWRRAIDGSFKLISQEIIEEGMPETGTCNPANRFRNRDDRRSTPKIRILD